MPEAFGSRLARLRTAYGWTQQALADRLALSRVAISHFEMGHAIPSERTIILLAGLFNLEPYDLVQGTFYPEGKMLRLPPVAPRYTEVELQLALYERDQRWLERVPDAAPAVYAEWQQRLATLCDAAVDVRERALLEAALKDLEGMIKQKAENEK